MKLDAFSSVPLCPSAQPHMEGSTAFGVISGTVESPSVAYLTEAQPVTEKLLSLAAPVAPTEVFRFAASCEAGNCQHFDGKHCRLATRIVEKLPVATTALPACVLRPNCRWWRQEGKSACLRCPQVVTEIYQPTALQVEVATP
ncbi:nitrogen fixation protein [Phormidium tenue FACHB-886]|nr:nitrogen fixation protein [Phormidium tenue FACHB-886]